MVDGNTLTEIWNIESVSYDQKFGQGIISRYMRETSMSCLRKYYLPGQNILEIGCGTGEEAVKLAGTGIKIFATDISPEMIKITRDKVNAAGTGYTVQTRVLSADNIGELKPSKFDGIYSSFGVLNCVPDVHSFAETLAKIIVPGGYYISSVMNKYCLSEVLYYGLKGDLRKSFRRWHKGPLEVKLNTQSGGMECYYYTPAEYVSYFKKYFSVKEIFALPFFLLPYMENNTNKYDGLFDTMLKIEKLVYKKYPFNVLGDHFMVVMQRR